MLTMADKEGRGGGQILTKEEMILATNYITDKMAKNQQIK